MIEVCTKRAYYFRPFIGERTYIAILFYFLLVAVMKPLVTRVSIRSARHDRLNREPTAYTAAASEKPITKSNSGAQSSI